jgi:4-alpha-glucanotransferase
LAAPPTASPTTATARLQALLQQRSAGVVLHITSLPGPHGLGDLGPQAWRFVDWLASAGQKVWQTLPINPVGPGDSPYQSPSAFAGSVWMVALEPLVALGWLQLPPERPAFGTQRANYGAATSWRWEQLRRAAEGFFTQALTQQRQDFARWCGEQASWLPDWTLFAALKDAHGGQPWWAWPEPLALREPAALAEARQQHALAVDTHAFVQWCFDTQWQALRRHAHRRGVQLMGDLPIFVAHDSADVWARPDLFWLDEHHQPTVVAGVPPDGYSPDGQRWGNPMYRWQRMQDEGFGWWVARLQRALACADLVRIDHFRGFAACWEVPASAPTARGGRWVPVPGQALFETVRAAWSAGLAPGRADDEPAPPLPIVAEDLGLITPDVLALRDRFGLPGMRIVYEAFLGGDNQHDFLPHRHVPHGLVYTSTHDSDTVRGFWDSATPAQRDRVCIYTGAQGAEDVAQALLRCTYASVARMALAPLQDLLGLGSEHRMNRPGTAQGNWSWRFEWQQLPAHLASQLAALAAATGR